MSLKSKLYKKSISLLLVCATVFSGQISVSAAVKHQQLDYEDSLESFDNPERGFYTPCAIHLKRSGDSSKKPTSNLVHLRIDIAEFSSNAADDDIADGGKGESTAISEDALNSLKDTLEYIREKGHTAIVRVCYDKGYNNNRNCEPGQEWIVKHLKQLGEVYTEYSDTIAYVELGMYGPWGEMHTSDLLTTDNVNESLNTLLAATPKTMKVGVRTPAYVAGWLGIAQKDFDVNSDAFKEAVAQKGDDAYRVGMYNDGYLGSSNDLGTFGTITREKGVEWLNEFAKYTLYGGECVTDDNKNYINAYNTIDYLSKEAFETHTTYLNSCWNNNVIDKWKNEEVYKGDDEYNGQTAYKYINDHLGYRLVLRDSDLPVAVKSGGDLDVDLDIENVGFCNIVNDKKLTFVLKNSNGKVIELEPKEDINPCDFLSKETEDVKATVALPELESGEWKVYLRISKYGDLESDNNFCCIRFGNNGEYWDSKIGANYIGSVIALPNSENATTVDASVMLRYIGGMITESEFEEKFGAEVKDVNGDGEIDLRDVIVLLN